MGVNADVMLAGQALHSQQKVFRAPLRSTGPEGQATRPHEAPSSALSSLGGAAQSR